MIGNLFKGAFGIVAAFAVVIVAISLLASYQMGGDVISGPIWILLAGGIVFALTRKSKGSEAENPSVRLRERDVSADNEKVYRGHGANIEVREDSISITRHGTASLITQGMKGEKRIPFASITAIQLKDATRSMAGYIQFSMLGGNESRRGIWDATLDENTVMFTNLQSARFHELRDLIEAKLAESRRPQVVAAPSSVADELAKLADLRTKGILTDDEFARQKASVLSR